MKSKHLACITLFLLPAFAACDGEDPTAAVCCTEFKVGASITADIGGGAESKVAVQAVSDFAGIASAAVDDITAACRTMAHATFPISPCPVLRRMTGTCSLPTAGCR